MRSKCPVNMPRSRLWTVSGRLRSSPQLASRPAPSVPGSLPLSSCDRLSAPRPPTPPRGPPPRAADLAFLPGNADPTSLWASTRPQDQGGHASRVRSRWTRQPKWHLRSPPGCSPLGARRPFRYICPRGPPQHPTVLRVRHNPPRQRSQADEKNRARSR